MTLGGDTYLFDVIDAGGLVFEDSLEAWRSGGEILYGSFQLVMGVPLYRWIVYKGKSPSFMDDDWVYPDFRKPPYLEIKWLSSALLPSFFLVGACRT